MDQFYSTNYCEYIRPENYTVEAQVLFTWPLTEHQLALYSYICWKANTWLNRFGITHCFESKIGASSADAPLAAAKYESVTHWVTYFSEQCLKEKSPTEKLWVNKVMTTALFWRRVRARLLNCEGQWRESQVWDSGWEKKLWWLKENHEKGN